MAEEENARATRGKRKCVIHNGMACYTLHADNRKIHFTGSENADYLEQVFKKLKYEVQRTSEQTVEP